MDLLEQLESELELSKADALKVYYFIQDRERKILESLQATLII